MANSLVTKIERINKLARGVRVTVKFQNFKLTDKSTMLSSPTNCPDLIFKTACELLYKVKLDEKVRLIGLSVKDFVDNANKKSIIDLFPEKSKVSNKADSIPQERKSDKTKTEKQNGRMSTEELEKELDDLEAVWFEKLDGQEGSEENKVLVNTTNLPVKTEKTTVVENEDMNNPFYRREEQ